MLESAYVSLESEIIRYIKYHVNPETHQYFLTLSTRVQGHWILQPKVQFQTSI
jgi:hypothetical protein